MPGAVINEVAIDAEPGPSWNDLEFGHMLQSIMQDSKITDFEIVSIEVSKAVSMSTNDFGRGSAFAGV
jgi:hypothetical protein